MTNPVIFQSTNLPIYQCELSLDTAKFAKFSFASYS
jgi:hypothetical protein